MYDSINLSVNFSDFNSSVHRIFDHQWEAEILRWFGNKDIPQIKKEELMQTLISFEDEWGNYYHYRAYLFAAKALAYFPESRLGDKIVTQVLQWGYGYFRQDKKDWKIYPQSLVKAARKVIPQTDLNRVKTAYIKLLHHTDSRSILRIASKHLLELFPGNRTAIAALILLLKFSSDPYISRYQLIPDLEEIGCGDDIVIAYLTELMHTTPDKDLCIRVIEALGRVGKGNLAAIQALVDFLRINQSDWICTYAAESLWQIDPDNALVLETLLHLLESHRYLHTIYSVVNLIAEISPGNPRAIAILLERISTAEDRCILCNLAEDLAKISPGNPQAIAILLNRMQASETDEFRYSFAVGIIRIQPDNPDAINTLSEMMKNSQDESSKHQIARTLLESNPDNAPARSFLEPMTVSRIIAWNRLKTAEKLIQIPEHRQQGISLLFEFADFSSYSYDDESDYFPAITILKNIDPSHKLAIQALVKVIETSSESAELALFELAKLAPTHKLVIEKIKQVITNVVTSIQTWKHNNSNECENSLPCECYKYFRYKAYVQPDPHIWRHILQTHELQNIVTTLKQYVNGDLLQKNHELYDVADNILWCCAQNLTDSEFYQS